MMPAGATTITIPDDYAWFAFPIPGATGDIRAAFLNRDLAGGPIAAAMRMAPGARIPAHVHDRASESFLVTEGVFVNADVSYPPGSYFTVKPGVVHGPHTTEAGCTIVFFQSTEVDPTDFRIAE